MKRYARSIAWTRRARTVTPGGAQTLSRRPAAFPEGAVPAYLTRGKGSHVWDVDGHEYIDWICGLGAIGLGYAHPAVVAAAEGALKDGATLSLPSPLEAEVAEALCAYLPCAQQVRFVKTGSEACAAAVRIARIATGRERVLVCGYHGWHDWYAASRPVHEGVPKAMVDLVTTFEYNGVWDVNDTESSWYAAVIMEAALHDKPNPGWLRSIRQWCTKTGTVLIWDENVTGFRWPGGSAQRAYGLRPDLAVVGKALANGLPLAAVVGPRRLMRHAEVISGTFGGDLVALAAAKAVLAEYTKRDVPKMIWETGAALMAQANKSLGALGSAFQFTGYPCKPKLVGGTRRDMAILVQELALRGVLVHPAGWYVSAAHTMADVKKTVEALMAADTSTAPLRGKLHREPFKRA